MGEGKSCIMMIDVYVCIMGKTVDDTTADLNLATVDYIKFQLFFDHWHKTTMIFLIPILNLILKASC